MDFIKALGNLKKNKKIFLKIRLGFQIKKKYVDIHKNKISHQKLNLILFLKNKNYILFFKNNIKFNFLKNKKLINNYLIYLKYFENKPFFIF